MKTLFNIVKCSIKLLVDLITVILSICILPFVSVIFFVFTIPKLIVSISAKYNFAAAFLYTATFLLFAFWETWYYNESMNYTFFEYLRYVARMGDMALLTIALVAGTIGGGLIIRIFHYVFSKVDSFVLGLFLFPISLISGAIEDAKECFDILSFGSLEKKEQFEIAEFRKNYNLPLS